jgi:hypothetical protein
MAGLEPKMVVKNPTIQAAWRPQSGSNPAYDEFYVRAHLLCEVSTKHYDKNFLEVKK